MSNFRDRVKEIRKIRAGDLAANPLNWRVHPRAQQEAMTGALNELGAADVLKAYDRNGVLVLLDGHLRTEIDPDFTWNVAIMDFNDAEADEYLATHDVITGMADTDAEILKELLGKVVTKEPALAQMMAKLAREAGIAEKPVDAEPQIDRAEELQKKWGVKMGDLYRIGDHRLLCGDSTKREDVERVMMGEKAEMCFTSPPYSDMREYSKNDLSIEVLSGIFDVWTANYFCVNLGVQFKDDEVFEYWNGWIERARKSGLKLLSWNVWDRINATSVSSQTKMFALTHEFIFVFGKESKDLNRTWDKSDESQKREKYYSLNSNGQKITTRRQKDGSVKESVIGTIYDNKNTGTVFTGCAEMQRNIEHPAMFPVELPAGYIGAMTKHEDNVCEPFAGSGTTLVACQNLSRKCRAIEIVPGYVAVCLQRMTDAFPGLIIELITPPV